MRRSEDVIGEKREEGGQRREVGIGAKGEEVIGMKRERVEIDV